MGCGRDSLFDPTLSFHGSSELFTGSFSSTQIFFKVTFCFLNELYLNKIECTEMCFKQIFSMIKI